MHLHKTHPVVKGMAASMCLLALLPGTSMAAVIEYAGTLSNTLTVQNVYTPNDVGPRNTFFLDLGFITVPQFDPSLGTLDSIDVLASATLSYLMQVDGSGVIDPSLPGTITVDVGYGAAIDLVTQVDGVQEFTATGSCTRIPGVDINCSGTSSGTQNYSSGVTLFPWMGEAFSQFEGVGTVQAPGLDLFLYTTADDFLFDNYANNPADMADLTVMLENGTLTVRYHFTPVPLPAASWLFASGLVTLGGIGRGKHRPR